MSVVNGIITAPISQAGRDEQNYYVTLTVMLQR